MKIRTLLLLCSAILLACGLTNAGIVFLATQQAERLAAQGAHAEKLIKDAFELDITAQEFVTHHEDRPKTQWYLQYAEMSREISSSAFDAEPSAGLIGPLRTRLSGIKATFDQLVAPAGTTEGDRALESQLASDLLLKTQRLISDADALASNAAEGRESARARSDLLIFALLLVLGVAVNLTLFVLYRRIVRPITRLRKGVAAVDGGDLDARVGSAAGDEVGDLSRAFDAMTAKLKSSYDTLEQKVEERTRELAAVSEKDEVLLQSIGDGVVAIDKAWNIILWNASASRITGFSQKEAVGKPFRTIVKLIRERDRKEDFTFVSDAMLSGKTHFMQTEMLLRRKDGVEIPVGDSSAPVIDEDGTVSGAIIVFRDSTAEREARLVRSSFAYASHQFRTPINRAMWGMDSVLAEVKDKALKERLTDSMRALRSVEKLSAAFLEVADVDEGHFIPKPETASVSALVKEAVSATRPLAQAAKASVSVAPIPKDLALTTDPRLLGRCLYEILSNAIHYGGGKAKVSVTVHKRDVVVEVRDQGTGIPERELPLVFTKFFRGSNVDATRDIGVGLGLYITKEYVRVLDGKIWFESVPGKGTAFYVSLPLTKRKK